MKKNTLRILLLSLLTAAMALALPACKSGDTSSETTEGATTEAVTEVEAIDPATFGEADITYVCDDGSILSTYNGKTAADFRGVCAHYEKQGYTIYSEADMGGNPSATFVSDSAMAHIYHHPHNGELNVVVSDTAGATLPPATPAVTDGTTVCSITQVKDTQNFIGMCYVIQLTDGSFIIYDGSYNNQTSIVLKVLQDLHKGEGKPLVRAWLLTHSHNDHYPVFERVATKAALRNRIQLEHIIVAPLNDDVYGNHEGENAYLSSKFWEDAANFADAKVVFAHTGMVFRFCNLTMEVLFSPESYYKTTNEVGNMNDTSLITRLYDESYSALFLGDTSTKAVPVYLEAYGDYLKSDVCQMSHHGVEADYILELYDTVKPQIMFYPASLALFTSTDAAYNPQVHWTLFERDYIKEILVHGIDQFTRDWGTKFAADAKLSIPGYTISDPVIGKDVSVQNNTGTRTPVSIGDWLGYRIRVNGEITGFSFDMPTWTTTDSACTLAVYAWDKDIQTTLAAQPIASKRLENLVDNATNRMNFLAPLAGGEYLFVIRDVSGTVGTYCNQGSTGGAGILYTPNGESQDQPALKIAFSASPASPFGTGASSLSTDKTVYTEGEAILITASGYNKDWVGIAKKGETTPIRWWYLTPVEDGVHAPAGTAFDATRLPANIGGNGKLPAGAYTLYLVADGGSIANGIVLSTLDITITPAADQPAPDTTLKPSIHLSFEGNANDAENRVTVQPRGSINYVEGKAGKAAVLGSAYVSIPGFTAAENSFTIAFWAKVSNLTGDPALIATKEWSGGSNVGFALGITASNLHANVGDGTRRTDSKPSLAGVNVGDWNHYTLVIDRDNRQIRVSINGGEFVTSDIPAQLVNAPYLGKGSLYIGQDATGAYGSGSMTCVMDELMVFDRALTQAELTALLG
jgi:hypothetical protein